MSALRSTCIELCRLQPHDGSRVSSRLLIYLSSRSRDQKNLGCRIFQDNMSQIALNSIKGSLNVITGCGSGLGRATLQWLLQRGSGPVLGIDRHFDEDYEKNLELEDNQRGKLMLRKHDTFDGGVESSLKEFVTKNGTIDNLINVAGVSLAFLLYSKNSDSYELRHAVDLIKFNTLGTFNMIRLASQYMVDEDTKKAREFNPTKRTKCIINTSCISTTKPSVGQTMYAGSKSSLDSITLCVARELSHLNIRCNTINVGYFNTKLIRASDERVMNFIAEELTTCPKRLGQPEEFAHLVQAIIENPMLNGCCIKLDGCAEPAMSKLEKKIKTLK